MTGLARRRLAGLGAAHLGVEHGLAALQLSADPAQLALTLGQQISHTLSALGGVLRQPGRLLARDLALGGQLLGLAAFGFALGRQLLGLATLGFALTGQLLGFAALNFAGRDRLLRPHEGRRLAVSQGLGRRQAPLKAGVLPLCPLELSADAGDALAQSALQLAQLLLALLKLAGELAARAQQLCFGLLELAGVALVAIGLDRQVRDHLLPAFELSAQVQRLLLGLLAGDGVAIRFRFGRRDAVALLRQLTEQIVALAGEGLALPRCLVGLILSPGTQGSLFTV